MAIRSKKKGKAGEKEVCALLESFFGKKFYRTLGSGADSKIFEGSQPEFITRNQAGDIVCEDQDFPFVVEVKRRGEISLWNILTGNDAELLSWIDQVEDDAKRVNKTPILFFRQDGKQWVFGLKSDDSLYLFNDKKISIGQSACISTNNWKFAYWK